MEIGKKDLFGSDSNYLQLALLRQNISFLSVHIDLLAKTHPVYVRTLLEETLAMLEEGKLEPLTDITVFCAEKAVDAFKLMSAGTHTGKIVVRMPLASCSVVPTSSGSASGPEALPEEVGTTSSLRGIAATVPHNKVCSDHDEPL